MCRRVELTRCSDFVDVIETVSLAAQRALKHFLEASFSEWKCNPKKIL